MGGPGGGSAPENRLGGAFQCDPGPEHFQGADRAPGPEVILGLELRIVSNLKQVVDTSPEYNS